jgi:hypothetical protein
VVRIAGAQVGQVRGDVRFGHRRQVGVVSAVEELRVPVQVAPVGAYRVGCQAALDR